jgi:hypothetical protein
MEKSSETFIYTVENADTHYKIGNCSSASGGFINRRQSIFSRVSFMVSRPRTARVLASLVASMTIGAIVLLALDSHPLPAGAFSLASYQRLNDIEEIIQARSMLSPDRWNCIEIYYSRTSGGNLAQLASLSGLSSTVEVNFHFVIYNGRGGNDGQIQSTERWLEQYSCIPGGSWYGTGTTIRICIVADGSKTMPTDCQLKRTAALVEELSHRFNISPANIHYPANWQL